MSEDFGGIWSVYLQRRYMDYLLYVYISIIFRLGVSNLFYLCGNPLLQHWKLDSCSTFHVTFVWDIMKYLFLCLPYLWTWRKAQMTHQTQLECKQKELTNEQRFNNCFVNKSIKSNDEIELEWRQKILSFMFEENISLFSKMNIKRCRYYESW